MIRNLRKFADWLEQAKCNRHNKWNNLLENLKTECQCEKYIK
jgi:hypothetical protein